MILRSFPEHVEHGAPLWEQATPFALCHPRNMGCFWGLRFKFWGRYLEILNMLNIFKARTGEADTQIPQSQPMQKNILASKDFGARTANLITYEDDVVWEADTVESFKSYAEDKTKSWCGRSWTGFCWSYFEIIYV